MLTSLITLECDHCSAEFEKHRRAHGEALVAWTEALELLIQDAHNEGWVVTKWPTFHICSDCGLEGVCPG